MKPIHIPIRAVGPGSQPAEEDPFEFMPLPSGMNTFSMPQIPESADAGATARARDVIVDLIERMRGWDGVSATHPRLNVRGLDEDALDILNELLGEGEVSVKLAGGSDVRIQESVFAGVWRERHFDGAGRLTHDYLCACAIPPMVTQWAAQNAAAFPETVALPDGAMNSPALLAEIRQQMRRYRPGAAAHVVNLTLLPLSPQDHHVLELALPVGSVAILSRGFGNCRITSTSAKHVWRVQYFNNMQTLILNTIEVVDIPEVALAARDDLADSCERLAELSDWMRDSCAA